MPTQATTSSDPLARLHGLLAECVRQEGSDLHLTPGLPPTIRIHGELCAIPSAPALTAAQTQEFSRKILNASTTAGGPDPLAAKGSADGALTAPGGARFRFNIFRRQAEHALVFRLLEDHFRTLEELALPGSLYSLCELRDGLVVISGATGAGKSTTLATLIDRINRTRRSHIVTIEDPIEYLHVPVRGIVNQRQVGLDAPSFNDALVASLRQDPDVILVGEIRDLETIRTAITAAETGHLVFTTLHAGDCVSSIERLVAVFPADEQDGIRRQLSLVLRAIVAQHLLPSAAPAPAEGEAEAPPKSARIVASEILICNPAIANLIASARSSQIYSTMEAGQSAGMQTLEQDLARLWAGGRITEAVALATTRNVGVLRDRVSLARKRNISPQAVHVSRGQA